MASFCVATFGYFINDYYDLKSDLLANKKNMFEQLESKHGWLFLIPIGLATTFFWILSGANKQATILLLVELFTFFIYSYPKINFKNNSILGPLCDAHYAHIFPVFISIVFLNIELKTLTVILIYLWLLFKGLRNILFHQLNDRKADRLSNLKTFPLVFGLGFSLRFLNLFILPCELLLLSLLLILNLPYTDLLLISFIAFQLFTAFLFSFWLFPKIPLRHFHSKFLYYLNNYYEFWLPVVCIFMAGLKTELTLLILLLHLSLYFNKIKNLGSDLKTVYYNLFPNKSI